MVNVVHICIDPLRVFADSAYDLPPEEKPRSGPGKGNDHTEEAITNIITMVTDFNALGIPTYWSYMEYDGWMGKPVGVEKSGGGLHPRLIQAFPNYQDTSVPKYGQSAFSNYTMTKIITSHEPTLIVGSGFLTSECVKDSLCDMDQFYKGRSLSHVQRFIARETTADNDDQKHVAGGLENMRRNGVTVGAMSDLPKLVSRMK